jgi:hypothetical protein
MKLITHNIQILVSTSEGNSEHCMGSKQPTVFSVKQTRTYVLYIHAAVHRNRFLFK